MSSSERGQSGRTDEAPPESTPLLPFGCDNTVLSDRRPNCPRGAAGGGRRYLLEAIGRELGVTHRVLNVLVTQPSL